MEPPEDVIRERQAQKEHNNVTRDAMDETTKQDLRDAIANVKNPHSKAAMVTFFEFLTGEDFEV